MFLNRKQNEGESVNTYLTELRALAIPCNYNQSMLNIMLRDVFVSGLRDRAILDRLFEEDDIDLDKTVKIALAMEKAVKGAADIIDQPQRINIVSVGNRKNKESKFVQRKNKTFPQPKISYETCSRCTGTNHNKNECRLKTSKCHFCQKIGHIQKACFLAKKAKQHKPVKQKQMHADCNTMNSEQESVPLYGLEANEQTHTW
jgi:hypothetical protein